MRFRCRTPWSNEDEGRSNKSEYRSENQRMVGMQIMEPPDITFKLLTPCGFYRDGAQVIDGNWELGTNKHLRTDS
jgi:hypothetical protein